MGWEAIKLKFHSLCHTWPLPAEHPLLVSGKWNQQELALPSQVLGGDLTPIDVQGGGAEPTEDVCRVLLPLH